MRWSFAQNAAAPSSASSGTTIAAMMPPFELPSQFSEDPLEEPSFAQVAGAPTLGSGVSSLVDVSTSGSEVCSVVRTADSVVVADSVVDWVVVVASVMVASTLTEVEGSAEVVVGATEVVSVVRGADGSVSGASEVEGSADGSDVVDVVGVVTSTLTEVEGSTEVVDGATEVVSVVRVVDSTEGSTETEVEAETEGSSEVEVGVSEVVGVVDEGDVVKLVEELGVGSFANSSSRFSCASLTRKKVRSRSACASLMSGGEFVRRMMFMRVSATLWSSFAASSARRAA